MTYDPAARISAADALQHAYFDASEGGPPSDNCLLGPHGERAGPYPPRKPLAAGAAQRKRKAEEEGGGEDLGDGVGDALAHFGNQLDGN